MCTDILYLASTNRAKLREFQQAASESGISVEPLPGIENLPTCIEDGLTFEENARKKAAHFSSYSDGFVFADDSGLCVEALDGAPGVHSARFAGSGADDRANNQKLLGEMHGLSGSSRTAHYVCVIALARAGRVSAVAEGRVDGRILEEPRGARGFGYDPLFFYPSLGKTFAELTAEQKLRVSHRGKAFRKLVQYLNAERQRGAAR